MGKFIPGTTTCSTYLLGREEEEEEKEEEDVEEEKLEAEASTIVCSKVCISLCSRTKQTNKQKKR